jgi:hypothetical protein
LINIEQPVAARCASFAIDETLIFLDSVTSITPRDRGPEQALYEGEIAAEVH